MLAVNLSYFYKLIGLSMITLIIFGLISLWNINLWQQTLLEKVTENQPSKKLDIISQTKSALLNERLAEKLAQTINNKEKSLVFTSVDLPQLPALPPLSKTSIDIIKKSVNNEKPRVIKSREISSKEQQKLPNKGADKQPVKTATNKSISAIYQQLISDGAISIELAWPNETSARQGIFTYLYQCIGMKFGVLNNQKVTLAKTFYQHVNANDEQQPSEWLRIAQGQLASQERLWLQQYHLSGTPVRLFPKMVDWQLAKLINKQLNGEPLNSLRAHYNYANKHLMLKNISLNGQSLSENWTLIENKCSI